MRLLDYLDNKVPLILEWVDVRSYYRTQFIISKFIADSAQICINESWRCNFEYILNYFIIHLDMKIKV